MNGFTEVSSLELEQIEGGGIASGIAGALLGAATGFSLGVQIAQHVAPITRAGAVACVVIPTVVFAAAGFVASY
ncbi:hypothetical protein [Treponema sp. J25]|uniref:hypothetical protein n=1 Tax=Treponema sp. J25 TaxID=2094121 RepID=UPI0010534240|nr:hypothetical protein [Treponema sp. J25]TCW61932.1 hypothetical protein C5O22_04190 [Treponema sp. J25]